MFSARSRLTRLFGCCCAAGCLLACSQPQPQASRPTPPSTTTAPTATPQDASGLFAVLTGGKFGADGPGQHDTVEIMGLDGRVRASATFTPRTVPMVGAEPDLQDEARVAAGRVYYADGSGVIRTLSPDGSVAEVARLPFGGAQQELSFAVSPDGTSLEAALLTLPPANPNRRTPGDPIFASGSATMDLYRIQPGQSPVVFLHQQWVPANLGTDPVYQAVGYDHGFIYTMPTHLGTQQPYEGYRWFGPAVHASPSGGPPSAPLGGSSCFPMAANGAGVLACIDQNYRSPSLRNADGSLVWAYPSANENYSYFTFSPRGDRLADFKFAQTTPARGDVLTLQGDLVAHPSANFLPRAWLDENTILGDDMPAQGTRQVAYVQLSDPGVIHDLGAPSSFAIVGALAS
jgi:hypothetical protein